MATSIRQRNRAEQQQHQMSPSSRGSVSSAYRSDSEREMTRIVIEENHDEDMEFDAFYTAPQPPVFIPDKHYKDFMLGRTAKIKKNWYPSGRDCASYCMSFSWVAVAFLFWVGFLVDTQPIFIKGVQPKGTAAINGVTFNVSTANQRLPVAATAWHAGYAYLVTILLCIAYRNNFFTFLHTKLRLYKRQHYEDIPDDIGVGLPLYSQNAYSRNTNRGFALWNRIVIAFKNFMQRFAKPARNKRRRE